VAALDRVEVGTKKYPRRETREGGYNRARVPKRRTIPAKVGAGKEKRLDEGGG